MGRRLGAALLLLAALLGAGEAPAGRACEIRPATAERVAQGLELAARTAAALDASGAEVVLLARAGQDLSDYGLHWSHLGIAYREADAQGRLRWRVLHKLNQCGTAHAAIYREGLGQFFLDDPWRFEAAWVVPTPELQASLQRLLRDPLRATAVHHRPYNLVAYPWSLRYQQSNQWAIETLAAAHFDEAATRSQAQLWLRQQGYRPSTLRLGTMKRLGGRLGAANINFDDHPGSQRFAGRIETVTVDSVFAWLERAQLASAPFVLAL
jgi:hypothetical protein